MVPFGSSLLHTLVPDDNSFNSQLSERPFGTTKMSSIKYSFVILFLKLVTMIDSIPVESANSPEPKGNPSKLRQALIPPMPVFNDLLQLVRFTVEDIGGIVAELPAPVPAAAEAVAEVASAAAEARKVPEAPVIHEIIVAESAGRSGLFNSG